MASRLDPPSLPAIALNGISKSFGSLTVFSDLTADFPAASITVILGPSGCGKTTLLNILAGMDSDYGGTVAGGGAGSVSYLFQEPRLLPWKTVEGNLSFVLEGKMDQKETRGVIDHHLEIVGLSSFMKYYPHQLSGGMKQRVSIARAFSYPARIILMDEPFQALDLGTKLSLVTSFVKLWRQEPRTVVFVTHDIQEALLLGDRLFLLSSLPAHVEKRYTIDVPQENRSLNMPELLEIEGDLYGRLGGGEER